MPDRTLHREPRPVLAARAWMVWIGVVLVVALMTITYSWGYDHGARTGALNFARRADCRAQVNQPTADAKDAQQAAFGDGMVAGLLGDDPVIRKRIIELAGRPPGDVLRKNATTILDEDHRIREAIAKRGNPIERCADGKP